MEYRKAPLTPSSESVALCEKIFKVHDSVEIPYENSQVIVNKLNDFFLPDSSQNWIVGCIQVFRDSYVVSSLCELWSLWNSNAKN